MKEILDSEDYGLVNAIKFKQENALNLIFASTQKLLPNIQETLKIRLRTDASFLHLASRDGTFSVFKIVSNFVQKFFDKEDFM